MPHLSLIHIFPKGIEQAHQGRNGGIELQVLNVLSDLFDGLVHFPFVLLAIAVPRLHLVKQGPYTLQEATAALDGVLGPGSGLFKGAQEHLIQAHGVGAIVPHDVVRVDDIAAAFGHLLAAFAQDLSLIHI